MGIPAVRSLPLLPLRRTHAWIPLPSWVSIRTSTRSSSLPHSISFTSHSLSNVTIIYLCFDVCLGVLLVSGLLCPPLVSSLVCLCMHVHVFVCGRRVSRQVHPVLWSFCLAGCCTGVAFVPISDCAKQVPTAFRSRAGGKRTFYG